MDGKSDVNTGDNDGLTALAAACFSGKIIKASPEANADVNAKERYGHNALVPALPPGNDERERCLIAVGTDPDAASSQGKTALMLKGNPAITRCLVKARDDDNAKNESKGTPLIYAVCNQESHEKARHMIYSSATINAKDRTSAAPLIYASHSSSGTTKLLVENGASDRRGLAWLTAALYTEDNYIKAGAETEAKQPSFTTALMLASQQEGSEENVGALIKKDAPVNAQAWGGITPLILKAALYGKSRTLQPAKADSGITAAQRDTEASREDAQLWT